MEQYETSAAYIAQPQKTAFIPSIHVLLPQDFERLFSGKHVVFITTKNIDYIRNVQELELIRQTASSVKVIASTCKSYLLRIISVYLQILLTSFRKYDCTFIGFAPQIVCPFWRWKIHHPMMIDFFISVYDTFVNDRKYFSAKSLGAAISRWLDNNTLKRADSIISDTKEHAKYFASEFGAAFNRLNVLYLKANTKIYYPQTVEKPERLRDKYVVLYFGSILPLQGIDVILNATQLLKDEPHIYFQIIGPVKSEQMVISENVEYIPWVKEKELAEYIAASDLCLAGHFSKDIDKARRTIAGKTFIYEAMNKPMILGNCPANREVFSQNDTHYFVDMGEPAKLAALINEIYQTAKENR